jgi:hypothetical protein
VKPLGSKRIEQTLVSVIQPSVGSDCGRPARIQTGSCMFIAFTGAFLRDRAKGSESVVLAWSWWLASLLVSVSLQRQ